jgi:hypothetical protein
MRYSGRTWNGRSEEWKVGRIIKALMAVIDLEGCRPSQPGLQALQVENPSTNPIPAYMRYKRNI